MAKDISYFSQSIALITRFYVNMLYANTFQIVLSKISFTEALLGVKFWCAQALSTDIF